MKLFLFLAILSFPEVVLANDDDDRGKTLIVDLLLVCTKMNNSSGAERDVSKAWSRDYFFNSYTFGFALQRMTNYC